MKVVIDRIEGDLAVLLISDNEELSLNVPRAYLPKGVKEGDHLEVSFTIDKQSRAEAERRAKELLDKLTKDSDPSQKKFKL
jgi:predicted RNA-binding protein (virulence factor B family)